MPSLSASHRRTHNLLLVSKILNLRDTASPLTLLLDSLEQSAKPLVKEYIRRAKVNLRLDTLSVESSANSIILSYPKRM
jgi:elongator complex protein 5